jgi:hypothetical protein
MRGARRFRDEGIVETYVEERNCWATKQTGRYPLPQQQQAYEKGGLTHGT